MKKVIIPETDKTPVITFDDNSKEFEIKGVCMPENILEFNEHVIEELGNYLHDYVFKTEDGFIEMSFSINFKLTYFNSAATKFIANVLMLANGYIQKEGKIKINWYFVEGDHDMLESGEDMSKMIDIPMNFVMVSTF
jgi:hypothetical protein